MKGEVTGGWGGSLVPSGDLVELDISGDIVGGRAFPFFIVND